MLALTLMTVLAASAVLAVKTINRKRISELKQEYSKQADLPGVPMNIEVKCVFGRGDAVEIFLENKVLDFRKSVKQN